MSFSFDRAVERINLLSVARESISPENVRLLIKATSDLFRETLLHAGYDPRGITRLTTKFRDAGRRSPPWKPTSSLVPGRPQDGSDGNRQNRWLFQDVHKFYADEVTATLVEIKYYFQALSMSDAPVIPSALRPDVAWLLGHEFGPGRFLDPLQLIAVDFAKLFNDRRYIESGHIVPLDRGGRHNIRNSFLILATSNRMQGNLTFEELISLMENIVLKQKGRAEGSP